jgi:hypothetical protein
MDKMRRETTDGRRRAVFPVVNSPTRRPGDGWAGDRPGFGHRVERSGGGRKQWRDRSRREEMSGTFQPRLPFSVAQNPSVARETPSAK